jgi:hypothetical protein
MEMTKTAFAHLVYLLVAACVSGVAHAQVALDPTLLDKIAKMAPGQSIVHGNSKLTLNQRNAGTKDADGSYLAESSAGGFSARFPAPVNEVTYSASDLGVAHIEENILFSETSTTRFMLTCMKQNKFKMSAETVDGIVKIIASSAQQFKSERFADATHEGFQYSGIDATGLHFAGQSFLLGDHFCQFMVGSTSAFEGISPEARTAFASFRPVLGGIN